MTGKSESTRLQRGRLQQGPPCPKCHAPARFVTSVLDIRLDKQVLVYRCDSCQDEIWR